MLLICCQLISDIWKLRILFVYLFWCHCSGTFGQVLECFDNEKKEIVAIKIVRSINKYREAAMIEIDVLQRLARHDIGGTR